jgi:hypothetical protein
MEPVTTTHNVDLPTGTNQPSNTFHRDPQAEASNKQQLRGSFNTGMAKFEYSPLRNTMHFNHSSKNTNLSSANQESK